MDSRSSGDAQVAWACALVVAAAFFLVWPFAELPSSDDWAYTHVALQLNQTGRLIYNGNESAMLVTHAAWGALFIRIFGLSFTWMRLSTLPWAMAAVAICYLLVRRADLDRTTAVFVSLLLGLSPMFLPAATSFMTDVPSLFFLFFCSYSLARAYESSRLDSARAASVPNMGGSVHSSRIGQWGWLALGVFSGLLGGTGRQTVWLIPLIVLPYLAWVSRRRIAFSLGAASGWVIVLVAMVAMTRWFSRQPYAVPDPGLGKLVRLAVAIPLIDAGIAARMALTIFLFVLPAAFPLVRSSWNSIWTGSRPRKFLTLIFLLSIVLGVVIHPSLASIPWMASTLSWEGVHGSAELSGRPIVLIRPVRVVVSMVVYFSGALLAVEAWYRRRMFRLALTAVRNPTPPQFALVTFAAFSAVYVGLLVLRNAYIDIFDRYLLPVIPLAAALLFTWHKGACPADRTQRKGMVTAWSGLAFYSLYAIVGTQDVLALARARVVATSRLEAAGVPRTSIDGGYEYNGWTELLVSGHVNIRWVVNPAGAYHSGLGTTPSVQPVYRLEYQPAPDSAPTAFGTVPYFSLLPPFWKQVSIDRIVRP